MLIAGVLLIGLAAYGMTMLCLSAMFCLIIRSLSIDVHVASSPTAMFSPSVAGVLSASRGPGSLIRRLQRTG